ncbi:hypothetical protein HPB48_015899 [Haemaphysalis longicornis]|uniref:Ig-like domain-containing protein n=1 Tax=Haemaphysalis longicornis TaxID=44386 RepID=A0A9J6GJQ9_HAELO|nr:hypothetical protein HPB48_015899 [Haemaphysalis longicornis]
MMNGRAPCRRRRRWQRPNVLLSLSWWLLLVVGPPHDGVRCQDNFYFSPQPADVLVRKGESATLRCGVSNDDRVAFYWSLNNEPVRNTTRRFQLGPDLRVTRADPSLDMGEFRCIATNTSSGFSLASQGAQLNILFSHALHDVTAFSAMHRTVETGQDKSERAERRRQNPEGFRNPRSWTGRGASCAAGEEARTLPRANQRRAHPEVPLIPPDVQGRPSTTRSGRVPQSTGRPELIRADLASDGAFGKEAEKLCPQTKRGACMRSVSSSAVFSLHLHETGKEDKEEGRGGSKFRVTSLRELEPSVHGEDAHESTRTSWKGCRGGGNGGAG